jgi:hypothetical protein
MDLTENTVPLLQSNCCIRICWCDHVIATRLLPSKGHCLQIHYLTAVVAWQRIYMPQYYLDRFYVTKNWPVRTVSSIYGDESRDIVHAVSRRGGAGLITGQVTWNLWRKKWHWGSFSPNITTSRLVRIMNPMKWSHYSNSHLSKLYVKYGNWFQLDGNRQQRTKIDLTRTYSPKL